MVAYIIDQTFSNDLRCKKCYNKASRTYGHYQSIYTEGRKFSLSTGMIHVWHICQCNRCGSKIWWRGVEAEKKSEDNRSSLPRV